MAYQLKRLPRRGFRKIVYFSSTILLTVMFLLICFSSSLLSVNSTVSKKSSKTEVTTASVNQQKERSLSVMEGRVSTIAVNLEKKEILSVTEEKHATLNVTEENVTQSVNIEMEGALSTIEEEKNVTEKKWTTFGVKDESQKILSSNRITETAFRNTSVKVATVSDNSTKEATVSISSIEETTVGANSIMGTSLSGNSLKETTISGNSITKTTLSANSIKETTLSANSIQKTSLSGNSINETTIRGNSIKKTLSANAIKETTLSGNSIKKTKLSGDSIKVAALSDNSIKETTISGNSIKATTLSASSIKKATLSVSSINETQSSSNSVTEATISDTSIKDISLNSNSLKETTSSSSSTKEATLSGSSMKATTVRVEEERAETLRSFDPVITADERNAFKKALTAFNDAVKANISYFLYGGTLLGSYRHHNMIPWDDDLDLLVNEKDKDILKDCLTTLAPEFELNTRVKYSWKLSHKDSYRTKRGWKWPFLDIFFYNEDDAYIWDIKPFYTDVKYAKMDVFPLMQRPFMDMLLPAPKNTSVMLKQLYDLNKCMTNTWNHKEERKIKKDYVVEVSCVVLKDKYPFVKRVYTPNETIETLDIVNSDTLFKYYSAFIHPN